VRLRRADPVVVATETLAIITGQKAPRIWARRFSGPTIFVGQYESAYGTSFPVVFPAVAPESMVVTAMLDGGSGLGVYGILVCKP
jgi:hypothetical protein